MLWDYLACAIVACLPPIRGLEKCSVIGHACDWWTAVNWYKLHKPLRSFGVCDTLGVTRLCLITPRVYLIHHSFLGVYTYHLSGFAFTYRPHVTSFPGWGVCCADQAGPGWASAPRSRHGHPDGEPAPGLLGRDAAGRRRAPVPRREQLRAVPRPEPGG